MELDVSWTDMNDVDRFTRLKLVILVCCPAFLPVHPSFLFPVSFLSVFCPLTCRTVQLSSVSSRPKFTSWSWSCMEATSWTPALVPNLNMNPYFDMITIDSDLQSVISSSAERCSVSQLGVFQFGCHNFYSFSLSHRFHSFVSSSRQLFSLIKP